MNTIKETTEDGQEYERNKMLEERCGNKHETITVVLLLFINLLIHCHRLALRICVFSTKPRRYGDYILACLERHDLGISRRDLIQYHW